jgi:hypothetical protein
MSSEPVTWLLGTRYMLRLRHHTVIIMLFVLLQLTAANAAEHQEKALPGEILEQVVRETANLNLGTPVLIAPLSNDHRTIGKGHKLSSRIKHIRFWFLSHTPANDLFDESENRYIAINDYGGVVLSGVETKSFAERFLSQIHTHEISDEDLIEIARTAIHLTALSNQNGWTVLDSQTDLKSLDFNMSDKTHQRFIEVVSKLPGTEVERLENVAVVTIYTWHITGGRLMENRITVGESGKVKQSVLGSYGGGGQD